MGIVYKLTDSISTDTIHTMASLGLFLHLLPQDYGLPAPVVSSSISLNSAIFSAVCLASRFDHHLLPLHLPHHTLPLPLLPLCTLPPPPPPPPPAPLSSPLPPSPVRQEDDPRSLGRGCPLMIDTASLGQCTVYSVQCTLYTVHSTASLGQCTEC